jgi:hypothetical protein
MRFRSKLKNKTPEVQDKIRKRLAADLSDSDSGAIENDANIPNKRQKTSADGSPPAKTVTVLGREMTREEYEALKGRKSSNSHLVAEAELAAADNYFDKMEKRDEMEAKMLSTFEMKTKAVTCHVCNYTSFKVLMSLAVFSRFVSQDLSPVWRISNRKKSCIRIHIPVLIC